MRDKIWWNWLLVSLERLRKVRKKLKLLSLDGWENNYYQKQGIDEEGQAGGRMGKQRNNYLISAQQAWCISWTGFEISCQVWDTMDFALLPSEGEGEVAQSCLTLCNPMDYSLPGSSIHGIFPGKSTGCQVGCHFLLQGNLPDSGTKPRSPALQADASPSKPLGPSISTFIFFKL